ncbi:Cytochrome O ubiquinol oxidase subunit CyoD [Candidatus Purcelliella pentastirinorum]|uniref:Cytochrome O ubiquinol oxidase subunit CyoD n=1 Tax=Candidatus Purcelliella pentastirinorum TaxID=472834 RepID=A0A346E099_9ENTR|nr:Cytochrome O ubiquinol oxidase subunit CyoD [Candidatus Purcelliella pentastirinorum]
MKYLFKKFIFLNNEIKLYIIGLFLSLFLVMLSFLIIFFRFFDRNITLDLIYFFMIFQFIIHLLCFLHFYDFLKWYLNIISMIFVFFIILIIIFGSKWILFHLQYK